MNIAEIDASVLVMIADAHSMTRTNHITGAVSSVREDSYILTAELLAIGCEKCAIYRQSDINEVFKLAWVLCTLLDDGIMRRMHAYKDAKAKNKEVSCGVYNYAILMAADILLSGCNKILVGKDQQQHVELARILVERASRLYGMSSLKVPEPVFTQTALVLPGLDGKKMSKSYHNTIPAVCSQEELRGLVYKIKTNSQGPAEPKEPEVIFGLYAAFASTKEKEEFANLYKEGIAWKHAKDMLYELLCKHMCGRYEKFKHLNSNRKIIDELWERSAEEVRKRIQPIVQELNKLF